MSRVSAYQFCGQVSQDGVLDPDVRIQVAAYLRTFAGMRVEIAVREYKSKRSLQQNSWAWGVAYPLIAESIGYDKHEHEELHYWLVAQCFGTHFDERIGAEVPNVRSSRLNTQEYSEYMEWLVRFAAQKFGVIVPLPNEAAA